MNQTTLKILPRETTNESLRIEKPTGSQVSITDPETAYEFLTLWFNYTEDQIREYWEITP